MAKFVDNYPEYRKMQGNVSKHVTLVTEMSKIVEERKLMLVSQTEQELACNGGQGAAFEVLLHFDFSYQLYAVHLSLKSHDITGRGVQKLVLTSKAEELNQDRTASG